MINKDLNMTPKQRVLCALNGEDVDRPPIVLGVVQALVNASMGVLLVYLP